MNMREVGEALDAKGIVLVNYIDPVDGSTVPGVPWYDLIPLLQEVR